MPDHALTFAQARFYENERLNLLESAALAGRLNADDLERELLSMRMRLAMVQADIERLRTAEKETQYDR